MSEIYCEGCGEEINGDDKGVMCNNCIIGDIQMLRKRIEALEQKIGGE